MLTVQAAVEADTSLGYNVQPAMAKQETFFKRWLQTGRKTWEEKKKKAELKTSTKNNGEKQKESFPLHHMIKKVEDAANISARSCPHLRGCCYTHMKQPAFTGMALERDPCELLCSLIQSAENRETDSKVFKNQSNLVPIWGMDYDMPHICRICHRLDF